MSWKVRGRRMSQIPDPNITPTHRNHRFIRRLSRRASGARRRVPHLRHAVAPQGLVRQRDQQSASWSPRHREHAEIEHESARQMQFARAPANRHVRCAWSEGLADNQAPRPVAHARISRSEPAVRPQARWLRPRRGRPACTGRGSRREDPGGHEAAAGRLCPRMKKYTAITP